MVRLSSRVCSALTFASAAVTCASAMRMSSARAPIRSSCSDCSALVSSASAELRCATTSSSRAAVTVPVSTSRALRS